MSCRDEVLHIAALHCRTAREQKWLWFNQAEAHSVCRTPEHDRQKGLRFL